MTGQNQVSWRRDEPESSLRTRRTKPTDAYWTVHGRDFKRSKSMVTQTLHGDRSSSYLAVKNKAVQGEKLFAAFIPKVRYRRSMRRNSDAPSRAPYEELPITSALWVLVQDTVGAAKDVGALRLFLSGLIISVVSWLLGGFDVQVGVAASLSLIFSLLKVVEDLRVGKFAQAAWRPFHFVLWMVLIALGNLADQGLDFHFLSLRQLLLIVVTGSCFFGSLYAVARLLDKGDRVATFVGRQKRAFHELLFADDEENEG